VVRTVIWSLLSWEAILPTLLVKPSIHAGFKRFALKETMGRALYAELRYESHLL